MRLISKKVDGDGYAKCVVCKKKKFIGELDICNGCRRFVCTKCQNNESDDEVYCKKCK